MRDYTLKRALDIVKRYHDRGFPAPAHLLYATFDLLVLRNPSERFDFFEDLLDEYPELLEYFTTLPQPPDDPETGTHPGERELNGSSVSPATSRPGPAVFGYQ